MIRVVISAAALLASYMQMSQAWAVNEPRSSVHSAGSLLRGVRRWGCQYLNIRVSEIAASDLDLIVVEPGADGASFTASEIATMKRKPSGARRLVLAYLSVGEAADYRSYWQEEWDTSTPDWIGDENVNWPHAYAVRFWRTQWQRILFGNPASMLDVIIKNDFDGVFLDRVDAFSDWITERPQASDDMIELVGSLARHARLSKPDFIIIGQNAETLLTSDAYLTTIDGVSKESFLYGLAGQDVANTPQQIDWNLRLLNRAIVRGKPVFVIEYLRKAASLEGARDRLQQLGFVPFFGDRLLDRLPQ